MFHDRRRFVKAKVWDTEAKPNYFPELDDPELKVPWVKRRRNFGVAFSGGGTRSASATLGQLRGLKASGLLGKAGYISAVSGGSWGSMAFTYLPESLDETTFLGKATKPQALKVSDFKQVPDGSMASAISKSVILDDVLAEALKLGGDETYARAVGNIFLRPFGLDNLDKFFTFHDAARDAVLAANSESDDKDYFLKKDDFYTVRRRRPYMIAAGTILRMNNTGKSRQRIQIEYTPLYTGVRKLFPSAGRGGVGIGGGYVESFAYDSNNPKRQWDADRWLIKVGRKRHRFTLSDVIGSSGAAPQEVAEKFKLNFIGFPEFRHWPIHMIGEIDEEEYGHGDGGILENLGIMPLLARKVKNIILFVNSNHPFDLDNEDPGERYANSIEPLFRPVVDRDGEAEPFSINMVFEEPGFDRLIAALREKKNAGETLIHCDTYQVVSNPQYKIEPYKAKICWIYNNVVPAWSNLLSAEVQDFLKGSNFERFPHYRTFLENPPALIDLTPGQVNALAHLSCWNVTENKDLISSHFGLEIDASRRGKAARRILP